jgi:hypothetical protein
MAASFVKKSDNLFYLRLTGNTSAVNFAAASEAGNTYSFYIARPGGDGGTITISKPNSDNGTPGAYTSNANPAPPGFNLDDSRFPGCLVDYTFSGSGLREYQVTGYNQNGTPYDYNASAGGLMCLGGSSLNWGSNLYAYPGSGYVSNPVALGVKEGGVWKNSYNIYTKYNGAWKECLTGWIKVAGTWEKFYQNYGNSSWINMLENTDDAIDFAIQVIEVWAWPISSFDYGGGMGPGPFESNATSDTATAPNSQSITLYIEIYPETGSYADLSLKRVSDGATIWSRLNNTSTYTETITFNVDAGSSYYFSSFVSVPSYGTSSTYVRRSNSSGTLVYNNSVFVYAD